MTIFYRNLLSAWSFITISFGSFQKVSASSNSNSKFSANCIHQICFLVFILENLNQSFIQARLLYIFFCKKLSVKKVPANFLPEHVCRFFYVILNKISVKKAILMQVFYVPQPSSLKNSKFWHLCFK